jgi:hypothetical protein
MMHGTMNVKNNGSSPGESKEFPSSKYPELL